VLAQLDEIYASLGLTRSAGARACVTGRKLREAA
jgi:hypothetical protein